MPVKPEESVTAYTSPPSTQMQVQQAPNNYRVQKRGQRTGSIVDPQLIVRGFEAGERRATPSRPPPSHESNTTKASTAPSDTSTSFEVTGRDPNYQTQPYELYSTSAGDGSSGGRYSVNVMGKTANGAVNGHTSIGLAQQANSPLSAMTQHTQQRPMGVSSQSQISHAIHQSCCHMGGPPADKQQVYNSLNGSNGHTHGENGSTGHIQSSSSNTANSHLVRTQDTGCLHNLMQPQMCDRNQISLYNLPSSYATSSHPLSARQFAELQINSQSSMLQQPIMNSDNGVYSNESQEVESQMFQPAHNCHCGDGCSCLGCAAHPYNHTTKSHVQDLGHILAMEASMNETLSRPDPLYGNGNRGIDVHNMTPGARLMMAGNLPSPVSLPLDFFSSEIQSPEASSTSPSRNRESQPGAVYSSSNYYTMEFEQDPADFFSVCTDVTGSCQCGSDCACFGCLTHTGHENQTSVPTSTNFSNGFPSPLAQNHPIEDTSRTTPPASSCCG